MLDVARNDPQPEVFYLKDDVVVPEKPNLMHAGGW